MKYESARLNFLKSSIEFLKSPGLAGARSSKPRERSTFTSVKAGTATAIRVQYFTTPSRAVSEAGQY